MEIGVWGLGFGDYGLELKFKVWGSGYGDWDLGFGDCGLGIRVRGLSFGDWSVVIEVLGLGFEDWDLGLRSRPGRAHLVMHWGLWFEQAGNDSC